ncbi:MAG TPA: hypothetical protein VFI96_00325 [Longimicrobiaceae bacterium]|nr:hypothetical protein [Longimicrobiaceae bacterium]
MRLYRDVLDSQMVDCDGRASGKVDGVVARLREGEPPVLVAVESGAPVLARRLSPRLGDWVAALGRHVGVRNGEVYRIPWEKVHRGEIDVKIDLDARGTPLWAWEEWWVEHVVRHIPGSGA